MAVVYILFGLSSISCQETPYRTEVTPNGEGTVTVTRVPKDKAELTHEAAVAERSKPVDPDLEAVQAQWANLSPADRHTVVELVQRLAAK